MRTLLRMYVAKLTTYYKKDLIVQERRVSISKGMIIFGCIGNQYAPLQADIKRFPKRPDKRYLFKIIGQDGGLNPSRQRSYV